MVDGAVRIFNSLRVDKVSSFLGAAQFQSNATFTGNVGIGTDSPTAKLHVAGSTLLNGDLNVAQNTTISGNLTVNKIQRNFGDLRLWAYEGLGNSGTAFVQARDDTATSNLNLVLRTKQATLNRDTLVLLSDGRLGMNGTLYTNAAFSVSDLGLAYAIGTTGKMNATQFVVTSDARLKQNIATVPDALSALLGLRGVTYHWNPNVPNAITGQTETQYGFLAQEVEAVLPALVQPGLNGYKAVNYMGIIPVTVEAIKALNARTVLQQKQIDALTAKLKSADALTVRMETMEAENRQLKAMLQEMAQKVEQLGTNSRR